MWEDRRGVYVLSRRFIRGVRVYYLYLSLKTSNIIISTFIDLESKFNILVKNLKITIITLKIIILGH